MMEKVFAGIFRCLDHVSEKKISSSSVSMMESARCNSSNVCLKVRKKCKWKKRGSALTDFPILAYAISI